LTFLSYILSVHYLNIYINIFHLFKFKKEFNLINMGIGDWGLGIGDWGLGPIPNPHPHENKIFFK